MMKRLLLFVFCINVSIICWAADTSVQTILDRGTLRVCTTGDYPPLTEFRYDRYLGIDIVNAKKIARHLNVNIKFIRTTWANLEKDLSSGACDLAVGGISLTPERQKRFLTTVPLYTFGKVPLVRCIDKSRYETISQINRSSVRVVENAGGGNEQFAKTYIKSAQLMIVPTKRIALEYLLADKADVFVIDNIEAIYRQRLMPQLCAVNPKQPFTQGEKVYLLPKNSQALLKVVDRLIKI
jgi:cyclohexadienyl dehydratase